MKYRITHRTEYRYERPVSTCYNEARLLPREFARQVCTSSQLSVEPVPADYRERVDFYGNRVSHFAIHHPHGTLVVTATSEIEVEAERTQLAFADDMPWESARERLYHVGSRDDLDARQYVLDSPLVVATPALAEYASTSFAKGRSLLAAVHDLMARIHNDFTYDPGFTTISTPLSEVFDHRRGVCQDFAHLAIACLRSQGIPARYVSGYVETVPPPGQARLVGADASHAWFSVYLPERGWLDFDPTNNQMPMDRHVTVAWGRDFADVSPLKGVLFGGGKHDLVVSVDVAPQPN